MTDLLSTFKQKADDLLAAINQGGGLQATIDGLRRQMAVSDRRRAMNRAKSELKRLDRQINELILAIGVQAVGLYKTGHLSSPELEPLCQHVAQLREAVEEQKSELAQLEALVQAAKAEHATHCSACGKSVPENATFCPHCGQSVPDQAKPRYCIGCGAELRPTSKFCAKCGRSVTSG